MRAYAERDYVLADPATLHPRVALYELSIGSQGRSCEIEIAEDGWYGLFTQHHPEEFSACLVGPEGECVPAIQHNFKPDHEHDDEVTSVGITIPGELHVERLNKWLGRLLAERGPDIYRSKGVLSVKGNPNRLVFQGVHMLFDLKSDRPWGADARRNAMIFIGRNLDREALTEGFRACLA